MTTNLKFSGAAPVNTFLMYPNWLVVGQESYLDVNVWLGTE